MPATTLTEQSSPIGFYDAQARCVKTTRRDYDDYGRRFPDYVGTIQPSILLATPHGTSLVRVEFLDSTLSRRSVR